jgi:hypothetical protein
MIRVEEIRKDDDQIRFALSALETRHCERKRGPEPAQRCALSSLRNLTCAVPNFSWRYRPCAL